MQEVSKYIVFNIREYLNGQNDELGEDDLLQILSEFSCKKIRMLKSLQGNSQASLLKNSSLLPILCFQQKIQNLSDILLLPLSQ